MVSMQQLPTSEACAIVMKTAAEAIHGAAQTNVNGNVIIENDNAGGLIIIAGVNRRIMAVIKCS